MMSYMNLHAIFTIAILLAALILLASQRLRMDFVALLIMVALIGTGVLTSEQVFEALGRPIIITVTGIFVLGAALRRNGVASLLSRFILSYGSHSRLKMLLLLTVTAALLSSIMSAMLVVIIFVPVVLRIGRELEIPPPQLLLPLALTSMFGNQLTLIGAPLNLIVSDLLQQSGQPPLGFFSFTPYAAILLAITIGWFALMGRRTLPSHQGAEDASPSVEEIEDNYGLNETFFEVQVPAQSDLVGERLAETSLRTEEELDVVAVKPARENYAHKADPNHQLSPDDKLIVKGTPDRAVRSARLHALRLDGPVRLTDFSCLEEPELNLCEAVIPIRSQLVGKTLAETDFQSRYGLVVLAINRQGESIQHGIAQLQLRAGDILLMQGSPTQVQSADLNRDLVFTCELTPESVDRITSKVKIALATLSVVVLVVMLNWVPLATALFIASLVLISTRCLTLDEAYASIDVKIIVMLAGMLPLATAIQQTGVAELAAGLIYGTSNYVGIYGALLMLYLGTALVAQVAPAAVTLAVVVPVAIQLAVAQGLSPQLFAVTVTFSAYSSYMTPLVNTINILARNQGNYSLGDFLRNTLPIFLLQLAALFAIVIFLS
jgi:di/tricarboxylate transporter